MKRFTLILIVFHSSAGISFAQSSKIDSLKSVLKTAKEDTASLNILSVLTLEYRTANDYKNSKIYAEKSISLADKLLKSVSAKKNTDYINKCKRLKANAVSDIGFCYMSESNYSEGLNKFHESLKIGEEIGDKKVIANAYNNIGNIYTDQGNYEEALKDHLVALKIRREINDKPDIASSYTGIGNVYKEQGNNKEALENYLSSFKISEQAGYKHGIAVYYNNIGAIYAREGDYLHALQSMIAASKLFEEIGDKNLSAISYFNIGFIYNGQGDFQEALKYYSSALKLFEELGSKKKISLCHNNMGTIYEAQGNGPEALKNYLISLKLCQEIGDQKGIAGAYTNIGIIHLHQNKYDEALKDQSAAFKIRNEIGDKSGIAESYENIGQVYLALNKYGGAIDYLSRSVKASKDVNRQILKDTYALLAEAYQKSNDYKNAYQYYKLYSETKDSLFNKESSKQITEMKTKYETEKKDKEIALFMSENKIKETEVKKQKIIKYGAFSFAALILLVAFIGFNSYRIKNKAAQLVKANEVRQKILRDLHDEIGSGLTTISMICEQAETKSEGKVDMAVLELSDTIKTQAHSVNQKLRELVWATNPENDNLQVMLSYIRNYVFKYFDNSPIAYSLNVPDEAPALNLEADVSRNLIFVLKEALNNCIKHSQATGIEILFSINSNKDYIFKITDNGKGIDYDSMPIQHSGLGNMRKRIEDIKGKFEIVTGVGKGTRIEISGSLA